MYELETETDYACNMYKKEQIENEKLEKRIDK